MQYKLISFPNQEGEWLIISDETLKINDFYCNFKDKEIVKSESDWINFGDGELKCAKIHFSTKLIDKSIPLIRKEQLIFPDEVDACIDYLKTVGTHTNPDITKHDFMAGYNKHAETHPFTLENMRDALYDFMKIVQKGIPKSGLPLNDELDEIEDFIESLQQPKKEYIVEISKACAVKWECDCYNKKNQDECLDFIPEIDKEGYINILSIK